MKHHPHIVHPDEVQPADDDRLYFFDANVWLLLLRPYHVNTEMRPYVNLWRRLLATGQQCVVGNAVVVSEVFNRFLRIHFDQWKKSAEAAHLLQGATADYKRHFRPSQGHKDAEELFRATWQDYEPSVIYLETEVESKIVPELLKSHQQETDFNDRYYSAFCKAHCLRLVSHDGDFFVGGVEVITANNKLITKYKEMIAKGGGRKRQ